MNLLLYREIRRGLPLPEFGPAFQQHMLEKRHPEVYAASLNVWNLLAEGLCSLGFDALPELAFSENGKPFFADCPLCFSLSHSARIAAVLISDQPCGVDVELIRPETAAKLRPRVLAPEEQDQDFFSVWTKKEAAVKLTGSGMPARPAGMDLSPYETMQLFQKRISDSLGQEYFLSALCENQAQIKETDC